MNILEKQTLASEWDKKIDALLREGVLKAADEGERRAIVFGSCAAFVRAAWGIRPEGWTPEQVLDALGELCAGYLGQVVGGEETPCKAN